jgi:regulator of cell morphogenesis and NO signaling
MEKNYKDTLLGELVAEDVRRASIFKEAGIDFCCGGNKTLGQACAERSLQIEQIQRELVSLDETPVPVHLLYREWDPALLVEYIINRHHKYVLKSLPEILFFTQKIASVHGKNHPELFDISEIMQTVNFELVSHLREEEQILFPAIKNGLLEPSTQARRTIRREIARLQAEHESAGESLDHIRMLSGNYQVPADGCNTYKTAYRMLDQFEEDLHIHVHLENNILFPKALLI